MVYFGLSPEGIVCILGLQWTVVAYLGTIWLIIYTQLGDSHSLKSHSDAIIDKIQHVGIDSQS